jgi:hypothetical protein
VLYNTILNITNPVGGNGAAAGFQPHGRNVNTYQFTDNATLLTGAHQLQLGGSWQRNRSTPTTSPDGFPSSRSVSVRPLRAVCSCHSAEADAGSIAIACSTRSSEIGRSERLWRGKSGSPLSLYSGRGTFNRAGRSNCATAIACNTAFTTLSAAEIRSLLGIHRAADGRIYWIDPKVIDPATGRAVGADNAAGSPGFPGQVFFNPAAGQVGNVAVMTLDGPAQVCVDLALSKGFRLTDRYRLEFKGEAFNLFNMPSFFIGDMDINSVTFGRLTSVNVGLTRGPDLGAAGLLSGESWPVM